MKKLLEKLGEELLAMLPPTIFFFVALHLVVAIRVLLTEGTSFQPAATISIGVAALILGKAVLIADLLPAINRFPDQPLAYNVAWKTAVYLAIASVIHYLERLFEFSREAGGIAVGNGKLLAEMVWSHYVAVQIVLLILIASYCTVRELARVIGRDRMIRLFFGPRPLPTLAREE